MKKFQVVNLKGIVWLICIAVSTPVLAIDWSKVAGKDVALFYPGQTSWQRLLTQSEHMGAGMIDKGKACRACHSGQEADLGQKIMSVHTQDAESTKGMASSITVNVKTAHDGEQFFVRLHWPVVEKQATNQYVISLMLDDGMVPQAKSASCWVACHADSTGMPKAGEGNSSSKYLQASRGKITSAQLLKDGVFFEYWQLKLSNKTTASVLDGYVVDKWVINNPPLVKVNTEYRDGGFTVVFSRKMLTTEAYRKSITQGKTYNLGIALHTGKQGGRHHLVSFEHSLVIDKGRADFVAVNQELAGLK